MLHLTKVCINDKAISGLSTGGYINEVTNQDMMYAPDAIINHILPKLKTWEEIAQAISLLRRAAELINGLPVGNYLEFGLSSFSDMNPDIVECLKGKTGNDSLITEGFSIHKGTKSSLGEEESMQRMHRGGFYLYGKGFSGRTKRYTSRDESLVNCSILEGEGGARDICTQLISRSLTMTYALTKILSLMTPDIVTAIQEGNSEKMSSVVGTCIGSGCSIMNINPKNLSQETIDTILPEPFYGIFTCTKVGSGLHPLVGTALMYYVISIDKEGSMRLTDGYYVKGFIDTILSYLDLFSTVINCIQALDRDSELPTPKSLYELVNYMETHRTFFLKRTDKIEEALASRSQSPTTILH